MRPLALDDISKAEEENLVTCACAGDQRAVIALLSRLQRPLYNVARRMVWNPADAEDLVQEAFLRILTQLASFRGDARFGTWAYRVALNAMLNTRRRPMEKATVSFEAFGGDLDRALARANDRTDADPDEPIIIEEVKIGCMTGMLLCLDRQARLAYILGEIFEVESTTAASLCEISPAAFRQRLSRARRKLHQFVQAKCGQVTSQVACRCEKMLPAAKAAGLVSPHRLLFAAGFPPEREVAVPDVKAAVRDLDSALLAVRLYREHPIYEPAEGMAEWLQKLLASKPLSDLLSDNGI